MFLGNCTALHVRARSNFGDCLVPGQHRDCMILLSSVFFAALLKPFKAPLPELLEKRVGSQKGCFCLHDCCVPVGLWRKAYPKDLYYWCHPCPLLQVALHYSASPHITCESERGKFCWFFSSLFQCSLL